MEGAIESAVLTCRENTEALNRLACMAGVQTFLDSLGSMTRVLKGDLPVWSTIDKTGLSLKMRDLIGMTDFNLYAVSLAHMRV